MASTAPIVRDASNRRPRVLFICGSINQTTQMHAIARELGSAIDPWFTPYYFDGIVEVYRRLGWTDMTIGGRPWSKQCFDYLAAHDLPLDYRGKRFEYDLVFHCQDAVYPKNIRNTRVILVQEGMVDDEGFTYHLVKALGFARWLSSTAATGLSNLYEKFCVASDGYRELFIRRGVHAEKIVVTGIPNFDDMDRYRKNDFPHRGYVLVATSDTRETLNFLAPSRKKFLRRCVDIARGRPVIFKLHPNEDPVRSSREIREFFPDAQILTHGSAEEMVANCEALVCEYSTLAFVGLALGKEVHSNHDVDELRRLLPLQNKSGAKNIAALARHMLGLRESHPEPRAAA